jgi:hypothetical protein
MPRRRAYAPLNVLINNRVVQIVEGNPMICD